MNRPYEYMLRCTIAPGVCEDDRIEKVVRFCQESHTPEVMFFVLPEEMNQGHALPHELEPWLEMIAKAKNRLAEIGVRTSINPWMTTVHTDRGRTLRPGMNFRLMVDPFGQEAGCVACPADEVWLDNLCECYRKYAELNPAVLWIEDDFRLHNHEPLTFGGCFCKEHMRRFSERAGKELTRDEFVTAVTAPGKVHPYRKVWLDEAWDTMRHFARKLAKAVFEVNPDIQIGLMTSDPVSHNIEGRQWHELMDILTGNKRPIVRVHLPSYMEATSQEYSIQYQYVSRLTKAYLPDDVEVYPELENFPDSRFAKSCSFSGYEIETTAHLGAAGVTLDIHDMTGSGVLPGERYEKMLADILPFMNMTRTLKLDQAQNEGIEVLVNPDASYTLESTRSNDMRALAPRDRNFAGLLSAFSVANHYRVGKPSPGAMVAVSGQYFSALTDDEVAGILTNRSALIDGETVLHLQQRGLLHLIGAKSARLIKHMSGVATYEEVCNGKKYCDIERARTTLQVSIGDFIAVEYEDSADIDIITKAHNPAGEVVSAATVIVNGRTLILPHANYPQNWASQRVSIRCEIMQDALSRLKGSAITYAKDAPYLNVYRYNHNGKIILGLTNSSGDDYDYAELVLDKPLEAGQRLTVWNKTATLGRRAEYRARGREVLLLESIPRLATVFLTID